MGGKTSSGGTSPPSVRWSLSIFLRRISARAGVEGGESIAVSASASAGVIGEASEDEEVEDDGCSGSWAGVYGVRGVRGVSGVGVRGCTRGSDGDSGTVVIVRINGGGGGMRV